jgi:polyisoprenoid-binding protein YceI
MKKILIALVIIIAAVLVAQYVLRAPSAPSVDISKTVETSRSTPVKVAYDIVSTSSETSFSIKETLAGKPFTAVGKTNQIAGTVSVEQGYVSTGVIKINARTFKTDSASRDAAIARLILKSEDPSNEFIALAPIVAPVTLLAGKPVAFTATTTVIIAGVSKPVVFNVTVKDEGAKLAIVAGATIKRSDFGLTIPNVPFVANVSDTFEVNAMITATKSAQ